MKLFKKLFLLLILVTIIPVVKAEEKANEIISRAEAVAKEIRFGSIEYAEDVLSTVEHNLKSILQEVERNRIELNPGK